MSFNDKQPQSGGKGKKVKAVTGRAEDLDAGVVWLRAVIASAVRDPIEAEEVFRSVPALEGLLMYKAAMARADKTLH